MDANHDFLIDQGDLMTYGDGALTSRIVARIFEQASLCPIVSSYLHSEQKNSNLIWGLEMHLSSKVLIYLLVLNAPNFVSGSKEVYM